MGRCPKPRRLLKKAGENFWGKGTDFVCASLVKVLVELFQKLAGVRGRRPRKRRFFL